MRIITILVVKMLAVALSAWLLPGVTTTGFWPVFWLVVVLVPIDLIIGPLFRLISLPITVITLGLFALVINGLTILLAAALIPGFAIDGLLTAILFSLLLGLVTVILQKFIGREKQPK